MARLRRLWDRVVAKVRAVRRNEPVRVFFQSYAMVFLGMATAAGIITDNTSLWIMLGGAALLGLPAGEMVRSRVTPVSKAQGQVAGAIDTVNEVLRSRWHDDDVAQGLKNVKTDLRSIAEAYAGRHRA